MDEDGDGAARAEHQRGQDLAEDARQERFDFLGYSFGPDYRKDNRRRYLSATPSKKSVHRLRAKVASLLTPGHAEPWEEVRGG